MLFNQKYMLPAIRQCDLLEHEFVGIEVGNVELFCNHLIWWDQVKKLNLYYFKTLPPARQQLNFSVLPDANYSYWNKGGEQEILKQWGSRIVEQKLAGIAQLKFQTSVFQSVLVKRNRWSSYGIQTDLWIFNSRHISAKVWTRDFSRMPGFSLRRLYQLFSGGVGNIHLLWNRDHLNCYLLAESSSVLKQGLKKQVGEINKQVYYNTISTYACSILETLVGRRVSLAFLSLYDDRWWIKHWLRYWISRSFRFSRLFKSGSVAVFSIRLLVFSFINRDLTTISQWALRMLLRLPYSLQRPFMLFLRRFVFESHLYLYKFCNIRGCWISLKGKIGRAGSVRKRKLLIKWGLRRPTSYTVKVDTAYQEICTPTGVLGLRMWLVF